LPFDLCYRSIIHIEEVDMKTFATIVGAGLATATGLMASTSAFAAVTVIGSSPARQCYLAAREQARGVPVLPECDLALSGGGTMDRYDTVATHVNRGILRMYSGNTGGAIADYDAAIGIDPDQAEAWLNKGIALMRSGGSTAEALPVLDMALAKKTREPALAYFARALAHEDAGHVRAAYADLLKARELAPKWSAPARELKRYQRRSDSSGSSAASH